MNVARFLEGLVPMPLCDLHHWSGHSPSDGPPDPVVAAFVLSVFVAVGIGVLVSLLSGGLLIVFTRRIRDMFWAIPATNLIVYVAFMLARTYPGGRAMQSRGEGLVHTLVALVLLLILSLILASVLALLRLVVRLMRSASQGRLRPGLPIHPRP